MHYSFIAMIYKYTRIISRIFLAKKQDYLLIILAIWKILIKTQAKI